jgi:hypothetical protein
MTCKLPHFYFPYQTDFKDKVFCVRFGILITVFLKVRLFWDAMPCQLVNSNVLWYHYAVLIFRVLVTVYCLMCHNILENLNFRTFCVCQITLNISIGVSFPAQGPLCHLMIIMDSWHPLNLLRNHQVQNHLTLYQ